MLLRGAGQLVVASLSSFTLTRAVGCPVTFVESGDGPFPHSPHPCLCSYT